MNYIMKQESNSKTASISHGKKKCMKGFLITIFEFKSMP